MKTMDEITQVLGYVPNDELRRMILRSAKEQNIPVLQAAAAYQMPDLLITDADGMIEVNGQRMKPEEYQAHKYKRVLIIK